MSKSKKRKKGLDCCEIKYDKECKVYVIWCHNLDLVSQGRTITEAKKSLKSCVKLYHEELLKGA